MKDAMADLYKMDEDRLAKEAEDAKKAKEAEDAKKAEEAQKNGDEKADEETKSVNLEEVLKQEGSEPNLSSTDN
jgi:Fic family protein